MHAFARLHAELETSLSPDDRLNALLRYLVGANAGDAAWAVHLLAGGKVRRCVPAAVLRAAGMAAAGLDDWLFDACLRASGDLAETLAQVVPTRAADAAGADSLCDLTEWMSQRLSALRDLPPEAQSEWLQRWLPPIDTSSRFLLVKLISGRWRSTLDAQELYRALAEHAGLAVHVVAQRMIGYHDAAGGPCAARYLALTAPEQPMRGGDGQPYPFHDAHRLGLPAEALAGELGPAAAWLIEWLHEGLRVQIVKRAGRAWIWARGDELVNERFADVLAQAFPLPDGTVIEGELLAWRGNAPAPFERQAPRLKPARASLASIAKSPVGFIACDVLETDGVDRRHEPQTLRRDRLEALMVSMHAASWQLSPLLTGADWPDLAQLQRQSRDRGAVGLMLKHREARYGVSGAPTAADHSGWRAWRSEPLCIDAILIDAQAGGAGSGGEFTFAVWSRAPRDADEAQAVIDAIIRREPAQPDALQLVRLTKASTGLSETERRLIDAVVRASTVEKFGPVRSLRPSLVFALAFEGLSHSRRHKSGLVLRSPSILRLHDDKPLHQAGNLIELLKRLRAPPQG